MAAGITGTGKNAKVKKQSRIKHRILESEGNMGKWNTKEPDNMASNVRKRAGLNPHEEVKTTGRRCYHMRLDEGVHTGGKG